VEREFHLDTNPTPNWIGDAEVERIFRDLRVREDRHGKAFHTPDGVFSSGFSNRSDSRILGLEFMRAESPESG
jgi:hypothetical protein